MTAQEKRERRQARHELQSQFRTLATRRTGLFATNRQLSAGARILADRYTKEVLSVAARKIETDVLVEAQNRAESQCLPAAQTVEA